MRLRSSDPAPLDKRRIAATFSRAASRYDDAAVLQGRVCGELLERLDLVRVQPEWILDVGTGTGHGARALSRRYRRARIAAIDLAHGMLREAQHRLPRFRNRVHLTCGDAERLPVRPASVDLIFSNLTLQWCNDLEAPLADFRRILRSSGLLTFTTFGPDTLKELRASWAEADSGPHVHTFLDMHDVGDALIRAGFSAPVLDVQHYSLTYGDIHSLMRELKTLGATNALSARPRGLTGKATLQRLARAYERYRRDGRLPATYEVIFAHAWVPEPGARPQDGSTVGAAPIRFIERRR